MKRKWVISYEADLNTPWIGRPERGSDGKLPVFFGAADSLVRFLIDGGLDVAAIRTAMRIVETGGEATVELADRPTNRQP